MQLLYGFLAAVVLCGFAVVAIYFITAIRTLQRSIDSLIPELRKLPEQVDASAGQVVAKVTEAMNQVGTLTPFVNSTTSFLPEFLIMGRRIYARLGEFQKVMENFYKVAVANSGGAIAPETQGIDDGGIFAASGDEAMAELERAVAAAKSGFRQPSDPLNPVKG